MATINLGSITVPNDKAVDVNDTISAYLGWTETIIDDEGASISNPVTKLQHIKNYVRDFLKDCYKAGKARQADSIRVTAVLDAEAVEMTI